MAVVVEAADELAVDGERNAQGREAGLHRREVRRRIGTVELGDLRRGGHECSIVGALRVEYTQRVLLQRDLALLAERLEVGLEVRLQRSDVSRAVGRLAERVEQQRHLLQPEGTEELPAEGDDLHVEVRVVGAEHFDAHLVELAVPPPLRLLVAELRAGVPDLPRRERAMLHERPADGRGELGSQRDVAAAFVDEVVHLLGHHIGGVADALEHTKVLQQRRDDLAVAGALRELREDVHEAAPAGRFGRKDVAHPGAGLELGHKCQGYRSPFHPSPALRKRCRAMTWGCERRFLTQTHFHAGAITLCRAPGGTRRRRRRSV